MSGPHRRVVPGTSVVDGAMDGVGILEAGTFVHANDRLARLHGYADAGELVDEPWEAVVDSSDHDRIEREVMSSVRDGRQWRGRVRGRYAGGETIPVELSVGGGEDGPVVWTAREAAPGVAAAGVVDGQPGHLARHFDALPVPVAVVTEAGEVRYCNGAALAVLGAADRADVRGQPLASFVRAQDRARVSRQLRRVVAEGEAPAPIEARIDGLDGDERIAELTVTPAAEGGPAVLVVFDDVSDRHELEAELDRYETIVHTVDDGIYVLDEDFRFTFVNDQLCELFGRSRGELLGSHARGAFVDDDELEAADAIRERLIESGELTGTITGTFPSPSGERVLESRYRLHPEPDGEYRGSLGIVRDVTVREERERALQRQRDELETVDRINELLLAIIHELVETSNREVVERTVCDRLVESNLYQIAWIGERRLDSDQIRQRVVAGHEGESPDSISATVAEGASGPEIRAIRGGDVQTAAAEESVVVQERAGGEEPGDGSVVAAPLVHRDTEYGVLVVHSTRPDAFNENETQSFAILGKTVGFAINEIQRRRLLNADTVTELGFDLSDPDSFLARTSERHDCRLSVRGKIDRDDRWILYVDVEGVRVDRVVESLADEPVVERVRTIDPEGDPVRLELVVSAASLIYRTAPTGVAVQSLEFRDGVTHVVVDCPGEVEVRDVVRRFDSTFESVSLVTRREWDRPLEISHPPRGPLEHLTTRQREVLEAAYRAGYFDWPRTSTGEDVADALEITAATFHAHLRKAEASLLSDLLD